MNDNKKCINNDLASQLEADMHVKYGFMVSGEELSQILGYPTRAAFRQAIVRGTVPIPVFKLPNRRGRFALVKDISLFLVAQRNSVLKK